ncbi:MAG TPA: hypothetical protein VNJ53_00395, partial [Gaiellaceae bacterium]|nr:hypothetical protein [Gaiellaceae bacterium]
MRVRALLLAALAALVLGVPGAPASQPRPVVGEGVSAAAERTGSARVVVALRVAGATGSGDVRAARSAFLARNLRGSGFRLAAAWATAPALAGTVTPAGLKRLRDDPAVLRVDLDRGGRAADAESLA